jgi:hypothetical protein
LSKKQHSCIRDHTLAECSKASHSTIGPIEGDDEDYADLPGLLAVSESSDDDDDYRRDELEGLLREENYSPFNESS